MQTLQYTRSLKRIVKELKVNELIGYLEPILTPNSNIPLDQSKKDHFAELLFASRSGFDRLMADPPTQRVLTSLEVGSIYDSARLAQLVTLLNAVGNSQHIAANSQVTIGLNAFCAMLTSLKNLEHSVTSLLEKEKLASAGALSEALDLQVVDYDGTGIAASRLQRIVSVLIQLHAAFAQIMDVKDDRLTFVVFDSGTDVGLYLKCAPVVIGQINTLISQWLDKVRFWKYGPFEKRMEVMTKGLTVMESVQAAVDKKVINEETGEILKARVLKDVDDLVGLGVGLEVVDEKEWVAERKLLIERRDTRLLGSGESPPGDGTPKGDVVDAENGHEDAV
jgi:hypothetical protein